jgi:hypothetical protein
MERTSRGVYEYGSSPYLGQITPQDMFLDTIIYVVDVESFIRGKIVRWGDFFFDDYRLHLLGYRMTSWQWEGPKCRYLRDSRRSGYCWHTRHTRHWWELERKRSHSIIFFVRRMERIKGTPFWKFPKKDDDIHEILHESISSRISHPYKISVKSSHDGEYRDVSSILTSGHRLSFKRESEFHGIMYDKMLTR